MNRRLLLGILHMAVLAATGFASSSSSGRRTHVDSLRQALGLSADAQLEWRTSANGMDTLKLVDNFTRNYIGDTWDYDSRYWEIKDGELVLNAAADNEWRYLATFKPIFNHGNRQIVSVSYRWGKKADAEGIGEGAHALMLDKPTKNASGYWLWRRTNQERVYFYALKDGQWEYTPGQTKAYQEVQSHVPLPKAGDLIEVLVRNEPASVFFDYFINGRWDATVQDTSKEFARNVEWYAGVFIHGRWLNNQVDDFTVKWLERDAIEPGRVNDLRSLDSTKSSVKLEWTMTGDNQREGKADHLEIRYATFPITALNFSNAMLAANLPPPAMPGVKQQFTVTGLQLSTQYYFALRVHDEAGNASLLSNLAKCNTKAESIAQTLRLVSGCDQSAAAGHALPNPVVVEVLDQYGLGFKGKSVKFVVTSGAGKLQSNKDSVAIATGTNGRAAVTWTLGSAPGVNQMAIRSADLSGSPLSCKATASTGAPAHIALEPNFPNPHPINTTTNLPALKVTDAQGNALPGLLVQYQLANGGGSFVNGQPPDQKLFSGVTDAMGVARASFNTSADYGDTSKIMIELPANNTLKESLAVIAAAPETLLAVSGDKQSALAGETLPQPLKVRVLDATGAPAKQYAVSFNVIAGGGAIGNGAAQLEVKTNEQGYAQTSLQLGASAGANQVRVTVKFKNAHLANSPFVFTAAAVVGKPSATLSTMAISPASGVPADSVSAATVTISVRNEFDAAMPNRMVRLEVSGKKNYLEPIAPTNAEGETVVKLRSTFAELKTIKAFVLPENLALDDSVKIRFLTLAATRMRKASGDTQTAQINTRLKDSLVVQLLDKLGNAPKATSVIFSVLSGGGKILGPFVVTSDGRGFARVAWQLGPTPGTNKLEARVSGLLGSPLVFTAIGEPVSAVEEQEDETAPRAFALYQNSPNPFNPETDIHFELAEAAEVTLELFDLNGRAVEKILQARLAPGKHTVRWNAKDERGRQLDSGVYLYRLHARYGRSQKEFVATKKLTLLK